MAKDPSSNWSIPTANKCFLFKLFRKQWPVGSRNTHSQTDIYENSDGLKDCRRKNKDATAKSLIKKKQCRSNFSQNNSDYINFQDTFHKPTYPEQITDFRVYSYKESMYLQTGYKNILCRQIC